jgi:hypothetical protein
MHGNIFKKRITDVRMDSQKLWTKTYHRARNSKNGMTFAQAEALFYYEQGYYPSRDLANMPTDNLDFFRKVRDVPKELLVQQGEAAYT